MGGKLKLDLQIVGTSFRVNCVPLPFVVAHISALANLQRERKI
jgi:hypothetical protein